VTPTTSDPNFDKESAEGSRDTVDEALDNQKGSAQGISNKPAAEEQRQQEKLPPRGHAKEG
jgi:hypothetical protein